MQVMGKAIEQLKSGLIVGHAGLGFRGGVTGSVRQQVHDGDTINVCALGNFGVRFLGVDAPEISFKLPGEEGFTGLSNIKWERYLSDPFTHWLRESRLDKDLIDHLKARIKPGVALNHYRHATEAEDELEKEVSKDLEDLGQSEEGFCFFLSFAYEVMDRYGRLLCFINRYQSEGERPLSYNERLLQAGVISPYFIWPNINPFREKKPLVNAVIEPKKAKEEAQRDKLLRKAREGFRRARREGRGIFNPEEPLQLEPFEVRFLADQRRPTRWVIDLNKNDDVLIKPQKYYTIKNQEDRLFVPEEYVSLFVEKGWKRQR
jgi:endonuclease YncB( thermonuclease family)